MELRGNYSTDIFPIRITYLHRMLDTFLKQTSAEKDAIISENLLCHLVIDYFADVMRVKDFHNISYTSYEKIISYTAYWLYRRKPLQVSSSRVNDKYSFINEAFISGFIADSISELLGGQYISNNIKEHLFYHLKYRSVDAQNLEMMIKFCASVSKMKY